MPRPFDILVGLVAAIGFILLFISDLLLVYYDWNLKKKKLLEKKKRQSQPKVMHGHITDEEEGNKK